MACEYDLGARRFNVPLDLLTDNHCEHRTSVYTLVWSLLVSILYFY